MEATEICIEGRNTCSPVWPHPSSQELRRDTLDSSVIPWQVLYLTCTPRFLALPNHPKLFLAYPTVHHARPVVPSTCETRLDRLNGFYRQHSVSARVATSVVAGQQYREREPLPVFAVFQDRVGAPK